MLMHVYVTNLCRNLKGVIEEIRMGMGDFILLGGSLVIFHFLIFGFQALQYSVNGPILSYEFLESIHKYSGIFEAAALLTPLGMQYEYSLIMTLFVFVGPLLAAIKLNTEIENGLLAYYRAIGGKETLRKLLLRRLLTYEFVSISGVLIGLIFHPLLILLVYYPQFIFKYPIVVLVALLIDIMIISITFFLHSIILFSFLFILVMILPSSGHLNAIIGVGIYLAEELIFQSLSEQKGTEWIQPLSGMIDDLKRYLRSIAFSVLQKNITVKTILTNELNTLLIVVALALCLIFLLLWWAERREF